MSSPVSVKAVRWKGLCRCRTHLQYFGSAHKKRCFHVVNSLVSHSEGFEVNEQFWMYALGDTTRYK